MARLDNWQSELTAFIEEKRFEPFDFANWNCMFWTLGCVEVITGQDFAAPYKGKFKNELGASKLLRKLDGVSNSLEFLEKYFDEPKSIAFARMGDIVLVDADDIDLPADAELFGAIPGICYGHLSYFLGETGLIEVETLRLGQTIWVL